MMPLSPITRRDWFLSTAATTASLAIPTFASSEEKKDHPIPLPPFLDDVEDPPLPMFDRYLGCNRFRTNSEIRKLQFSPDGKKLYAMTPSELYVWDYQTGQTIARRKMPDQLHRFYTIFAHTDCLNALIFNRDLEHPVEVTYCRHVRFDAKTLHPLSQLVIPYDIHSNYIYHPNGEMLFASHCHSECLYDLDDGHLIGKSRVDNPEGYLFNPTFSPDRKAILSSVNSNSEQPLKICDMPQLNLKLYIANGNVIDNVCWMPDGNILAIRKELDRFVYIDSKGNFVNASSKLSQSYLKLVDVTLNQHYAILSDSGTVCFEPIPGKWLPRIRLPFQANDFVSVAKRMGDSVSAFHYLNCVFFLKPSHPHVLPHSADYFQNILKIHWNSRNELTAIGCDFQMKTYRIDRPSQPWTYDQRDWWSRQENLKFSADGSTAVANDWNWIRSFDAKTGRQVNAVRLPDIDLLIQRITDDSHYVLGEKNNNQFWKVDLRNGKYQKLLLLHDVGNFEKPLIQIERTMGSKCAVVCKRGEIAELFILDIDTMKVLWKYRCTLARNELPVAFCRDGQFIVICQEDVGVMSEKDSHPTKIAIMSSLCGRVLRQVYVREKVMKEEFFVSPDSRIMIVPQYDQLSIREMATLEERFHFPLTTYDCISVSPDSRYLAKDSFCNQYPIDLFNLRGEVNPADPIPDDYSLKQAWIDLQSLNARIGFRAIRYLAKHPESSLKLFRSKIRHVNIGTDRQIQRWIADLDDDDFDVRESAQRQLHQTGRRIRETLNEALLKTHSVEVRRRVKQLLESFENINVSHVVIERACEVLQWIESAAAKALLRQWADGNPLDHLTEEAIETLKTLDRLEKMDRESKLDHSPAMPAPSR